MLLKKSLVLGLAVFSAMSALILVPQHANADDDDRWRDRNRWEDRRDRWRDRAENRRDRWDDRRDRWRDRAEARRDRWRDRYDDCRDDRRWRADNRRWNNPGRFDPPGVRRGWLSQRNGYYDRFRGW